MRDAVDPIAAELVRGALIYASEEMGVAVRNAAYSPNIKERLDHSCAVFDREGRLIAQAEHIPVHLGSLPWGLGRTLEVLRERNVRLAPGEMWIVNDPYVSGTHLNDITVIRPVFAPSEITADDIELAGFVANKAHHTDVGGSVPGSMSADATELCIEGLILPPMRLMREDRVDDDVVELVRANSRTPHARSGDLKAQIAGNLLGERRLLETIARFGRAHFDVIVSGILDESERRMRAALAALGTHDVEVRDVLEAPSGELLPIVARVRVAEGAIAIDYAGTHGQVNFPMNAVFGVTLSGVHYALRAFAGADIPMNEGCFRPVSVSAPLGSLLNPRRPAPVAGGNVETSQRNADVILRALAAIAPERLPAQSSGTMSNVMAGGVDGEGVAWAFYETNGGGMGARPDADGIDGIHTHMTNTLNTPIEAIERYLPLRVTRYEFAEDTGGAGRYRGGRGLVRSFRLLAGTATVSLLAERHRVAPSGAHGGGDGVRGEHTLRRADGSVVNLPSKTSFALAPDDEVIVQTPGGGGFGVPD
jgi:N-methylhydantoinase B